MQAQQLEAIAYKACFSINQQERFFASNAFLTFMYSLNSQHIPSIMRNFSPNVLFVFSQYFNKYFFQYLQKGHQTSLIFSFIQETISLWFTQSGLLIRNSHQKPLQKYIRNSVSLLFGRIMKQFFSLVSQKKIFLQYLKNIQNLKYKIFVYKSFIQAVSTIQTRSGYMGYKTLIYSFQDQIIPMITEDLVPIFIGLTDKIKVNQISCMMPRLSQQQEKTPIILVNETEKCMTQIIFDLLKQVTNFSYNISFSEYDLQTVYQNCLICFPQSLISKIISKQFLESLYFVIQKMINVGDKDNYLMTCFDCLKKILLTKTSLCNKQTVFTYIKINLKGLNDLFMNPKIIGSRLADLIQCGQKFIVSIQINQLNPLKEQYLNWISSIKMRVVHIVTTQKLNHQNDLLLQSADLVLKLLGEALSPFFRDDLNIFVDIATTFGLSFINGFLSKDQNVMGDVKLMKLSHYKKVIQQFLRPFLSICSMNTSLFIKQLADICDIILQSQNIQRISHYLILISEVAKQNYLERNVLYETQQRQNFIPLGGIIHKIYSFIDLYKSSSNRIQQLDVAVIIFIDSILEQLLLGLDFSGVQIKLNGSIVYYLIQSFKTIPSQDQDIALYHLKQIMTILLVSNSIFSQYILDSVYKHLLKIKWGLRRQTFKQTKIYSTVLQICSQVSKTSISNQVTELKWRKQLFRIIGLLNFDDIQDSYKQNVNFILQMVQIDFKSESYAKVIFDLTGICENIDSPIIYRYFLINLQTKIGIKNIMEKLFNSFAENQTMLKQILKLNIAIIQNKAHRFISKKILIKFYQILNILIPFWSTLICSAIFEQWSDILKQLYKILIICFGEEHINLYLLRRNNKQIFDNFLFNSIKNLSYCYSWINQFPKINNTYLELLNLVSTNHLQILLSSQNQTIIKEFDNLFENIFAQILLGFQELLQGKKSTEKFLIKLLDFIKNVFTHLRKMKPLQHKLQQNKNIQLIIQKGQNKLKFLLQLYKYGFGNLRNFTTIFNLNALIIYQMSFIYKQSYKSILTQLRIFGKRAQDFYKIHKVIAEGKEDHAFTMNLKDWMKQCDNDCESEIDY